MFPNVAISCFLFDQTDPPSKNNLSQSLRLKWHTVTAIYVHILCTLHYFVVFKVIL